MSATPRRGRHTTDPAHMPKAHQRHLEWTPSRFITGPAPIGPQTRRPRRGHPRRPAAPRAGLPLLPRHLAPGRRDGDARLEAACARAVAVGARSYRHVDSILKHGLDRLPLLAAAPAPGRPAPVHEHVRGPRLLPRPRRPGCDRARPGARDVRVVGGCPGMAVPPRDASWRRSGLRSKGTDPPARGIWPRTAAPDAEASLREARPPRRPPGPAAPSSEPVHARRTRCSPPRPSNNSRPSSSPPWRRPGRSNSSTPT